MHTSNMDKTLLEPIRGTIIYNQAYMIGLCRIVQYRSNGGIIESFKGIYGMV